jgi:hypothetical protein
MIIRANRRMEHIKWFLYRESCTSAEVHRRGKGRRIIGEIQGFRPRKGGIMWPYMTRMGFRHGKRGLTLPYMMKSRYGARENPL